MSDDAISLGDVHAAAERVRPHVFRTPVVPSEALSRRFDCDLSFKAENLQHIGAFKARGATNAVLALTPEEAAKGVVTHSSGNHAAALARAASIREVPAHVVMPHNSSPRKIAAVRSFGVEPVFCEPSTQERERTADEVQRATGATLVHPYDNPNVMAGQGTVGLEILDQSKDVDVVLVPVGGGGLLSGVLTAIKNTRPEVTVIAVEPELANDAARSLMAGSIQMPTRYDTIADGLRTAWASTRFRLSGGCSTRSCWWRKSRFSGRHECFPKTQGWSRSHPGRSLWLPCNSTSDALEGRRVVAVVSGGNLDMSACHLGQSGTRDESE